MAHGLGNEHLNKCGHEGCVCMVKPGQSYCSDFCARASGAKTGSELPGKHLHHGHGCECGHDACEHAHARGAAKPSGLEGSKSTDEKLHEAGRKAFQETGED